MNSEFTLASPNQSHVCDDSGIWPTTRLTSENQDDFASEMKTIAKKQQQSELFSILEQQRSTPWS